MNSAQSKTGDPARSLFLAALEPTEPGERAAFLKETCAHNPSLRAAVEALLEHHKEDGFLESPAFAAPPMPNAQKDQQGTAIVEVIGEKPGDRAGRYKLLQQIGEGGIGVV